MNLIYNLSVIIAQFKYFTGLHNKYILLRNSKALRNTCVCFQMAIFTMHRNRIFRFYERIDQLQFFLTGMS